MAQTRQSLLRGYVFIGGGLLIAAILFYTARLAQEMEAEAQSVSFLFAQFAANTALTVNNPDTDPEVIEVYRDVISRINFPIVLTDARGIPHIWRHIGVDLSEVTDTEILQADPEDPPDAGPYAVVFAKRDQLAAMHDPIPLRFGDSDRIQGYVYFGRSSLVTKLRYFPLIELSLVVIFLVLALLGYRSIKESEQRNVWVGMAKETAHQLGTPISSLMGWLELLRARVTEAASPAPAVSLDRAFLDDVLAEMENDTARLTKIAARFSNVGSVPKLVQQDIVPVVGEATRYLLRRLPQMGATVQILEKFEEVPVVNINRELMAWVVENLLKNALDSVDKQEGVISVEVRREPHAEAVDVRVSDNGRGMTAEERRRVFDPGFTTKKRGWGLGLSLSKRIVEEYHGGRIFVERAAPGEGSTFVVRFPV